MTQEQWQIFCDFKKDFKQVIDEWSVYSEKLMVLQKEAALAAKNPLYSFETPLVYNKSLDEITQSDEIKLIVIGDNPGKDEQLKKNNRYLVGQAGKIAQGYFEKNAELGIDFRKNVIILNKTPVHSAKTSQLKFIEKSGGPEIAGLLEKTQIWMAERTARLHIDLNQNVSKAERPVELWLVGYSELKEKGIFEKYKTCLKSAYEKLSPESWDKVYVFQHFSMNRFSIDLKDHFKEKESLLENIHRLGLLHKQEIFGL